MNPKDLERGYSDTGYIAETNEDVFKDHEAEEMNMRKKYGMCCEEDDSSGFIERRNTHERM